MLKWAAGQAKLRRVGLRQFRSEEPKAASSAPRENEASGKGI